MAAIFGLGGATGAPAAAAADDPRNAGEPSGPLTALWVTVFALANAYAAFFLAFAFFNAHPGALRGLRARAAAVLRAVASACCSGGSSRRRTTNSSGETPCDAAVAGLDGSVAEEGEGSPASAQKRRQRWWRGGAAASGGDSRGGSGGQVDNAAGEGEDDDTLQPIDNDQQRAYSGGLISSVEGEEGGGGNGTALLLAGSPVALEWRGLSLSVQGVAGRRQILEGVYGEALPGQLQALMGPSGAGKSTLLDLLAMRVRAGRGVTTGGDVLVNSAPRAAVPFLAASTYVPQHDSFVPTMTAAETVGFYASVVLPPTTSPARCAARAREVLSSMGLSPHSHTLVGGALPGGLELRGLSGGERRRLAIAAGVVAGPALVFLDEPTSGLDSFAALNVARFLHRMASGGHTVIASVHQPRAAIWRLFDQITLLSGGRLMYHGPRSGLVDWFTRDLGYTFDPNRHGSPADWALDLVSLGFHKATGGGAISCNSRVQTGKDGGSGGGGSTAQAAAVGGGNGSSSSGSGEPSSGAGAAVVAAAWPAPPPGADVMLTHSELAQAADAMRARLTIAHPAWFAAADATTAGGGVPAGPVSQAAAHAPAAAAGGGGAAAGGLAMGARRLWRHYRALLWREALIQSRNPADAAGRMLTFAYVALLDGLIVYGLAGSAEALQDRIGATYTLASFFLLMPFVFMGLYWGDKAFFLADSAARLYHPFPYYAAKFTAALPFNIAAALSFALILYGLAGLRHAPVAVVQSALLSVLLSLTANQVLYCCATIAASQDVAFMAAIAWTALNLLACGFLQRFSDYGLPGLAFVRYLSTLNWAWEGLVGVELRGRRFPCVGGGDAGLSALGLSLEVIPQEGSLGAIASAVRRGLGNGCVADGDAVLTFFDATTPYGMTVGILVAYLVGFTGLTYLALWRAARRQGPGGG